MATVIVIHGTHGNPDENWFPWLKSELEALGHKVIVPAFPTPDDQALDSWMRVFSQLDIDGDCIMVGHSLGCAFILNVAEQRKIASAFLVAGWTGPLNNPLDELNKSFVERDFDWDKIRANCAKLIMFNSVDDPYVPLHLALDLANSLQCELTIVKDAGHFNAKSGYTTFERLLDRMKKDINP